MSKYLMMPITPDLSYQLKMAALRRQTTLRALVPEVLASFIATEPETAAAPVQVGAGAVDANDAC